MLANSILTVVIIVGLFRPTCYQHVMFFALGDPELERRLKEKKEKKRNRNAKAERFLERIC